MQSVSLTGSDFFSDVGCPGASLNSKTLTGQTSMHMPSPLQTSQSTATVVPWIPSFIGGSTGPHTSWPACLFTTFLFFAKLESIPGIIQPHQNIMDLYLSYL